MDLSALGNVAYVFPDHFDVDLIIGVQNVRENDLEKLVPLCMKGFDDDFLKNAKAGDIFIGGRNFGYGHAHPQSMGTIRKVGINVVLAESFAPGFYRGELINGMYLLKVPGITEKAKKSDLLKVDFHEGIVTNITQGTTIQGVKPSPIVIELVQNKGNIGLIKRRIEELNERAVE